MSHLKETEDNIEFNWGVKKGIGGPNGDVQFYESFTYDSIEYFLYDCIYVYRKNEHEPDIGRIVEIWETPSYEKKVKIVWFFRPIEVYNRLGDVVPLQNEIFLASGEGKGLSNLNPLEAICGKCNVVCTSKDKRNPQESEVKIKMAEYVFSRTFDVSSSKILEKFPDTIAGIKLDYFFNKRRDHKAQTYSSCNLFMNPYEAMKNGNMGFTSLKGAASKKIFSSLGESVHQPHDDIILKAKTFIERVSCWKDERNVKFRVKSSATSSSLDIDMDGKIRSRTDVSGLGH